MRSLIGCFVLIAGMGSLGYLAMTQNALRMQSSIYGAAQVIAENAPHGITAQVSGRDVLAFGRVTDEAEFSTLSADLHGIEGVRIVDSTGVELLPFADPYEIIATYSQDAVPVLDGYAPTESARLDFLAGATGDLTIAAGVPDANWVSVAADMIAAAQALQWGDVQISGTQVSVRGQVATPDILGDITEALAALPDGYTSRMDVSVEDDGTPLRLDVSLEDGVVGGRGKFPQGMTAADITGLFETATEIDLIEAIIPAQDTDWPASTRTALAALALLIEGELSIDGPAISLTGRGTPDGLAQAETLLEGLPASRSVTTELGLWDDGAPLQMIMTWDGETAESSGKFPADFAPRGPTGVQVDQGDIQTSFLTDQTGAFTSNANAGVAALGLMTTGTLRVTSDTIELTGTAASPQVGVVMGSVLENAASGAQIDRAITYLDDGSPAAWSLQYSATGGASIEGRLPTGLSTAEIASTLGVPDLAGAPSVALEDDDVGSSLDALAIAATYLPEIETFAYAHEAEGSAIDLILSPGVDLDLVASDLAERLPADVAFSLGPLDAPPSEGTRRTNAATGLDEVFTTGFWLPSLDFAPDIAGCTAASDAVLAATKITFVTGSARLDATSIRAINGVAAVARPCIDAGLWLEIGGHTDATGDAQANENLSFLRAAAVRAVLIDRGVTADVMTPVGYGASDPIADNDTDEGRAANRRTTLVWSQTPPQPATNP